ncbi:MAG: hypothetical protein KDA27_01535 [Candidatus Eisenbacteria bacterium]|uniref:histidine kinase n=1 Tax=Eiseniibacteriota bacterium TaxID=2212470 RepID=A0A956N9W5_UNCEI|nr:hypothetical protein [Candidatus Eisenbacteria bacterium]MCB9466372.1 hypothetical protein [Candidatus Eisenbacteria bacterium]
MARAKRRASADPAAFPAKISRALTEAVGTLPYRLYLAETDESVVLLHDGGLVLDDDALEVELSSLEAWALEPGPDPTDSTWARWPLRWEGDVVGGLVLPAPGLAKIRSEPLDDVALYLRLRREEARTAALAGFRDGAHSALPYGFLSIDGLGRITDYGGRAEQILGVTPKDALGVDCVRVFRPVGLEEHPLLQALREPIGTVELYISRPEGGEVPVLLQTWRFDMTEGRPYRLYAFFEDLSEERSHAEAERQREKLAVLGELSAGIAHEIRNPLTGIANCAQVLQEDLGADHKGQRFLRIVLDEVARLNRIVEGLLGYARPNHPEMRSAEIEDCIRRVLELTKPELEDAGIRVEYRVRGRIPRVFLDSGQVEQVLLNLVRNARDAMKDGGELTVQVAVIRRSPYRRKSPGRRATDVVRRVGDAPRQRFVQIQITDTGGGIPKEILSRIWNPFFTTRPKGTGLGLSLSQSIVREHGGFLSLRPVENKGTTALLDLPIERRQGERRRNDR